MKIQYQKSESVTPPLVLDTSSSKTSVYIRKNIEKKQRTSDDGEVFDYYEYDEAKLTMEEWAEYQRELEFLDIRQQRADIDYVALMSGISLEDEYEQGV